MILLIDNYDSFTYNLKQIVEELGFECKVVRNDQVTLEQIATSAPDKILLSPGPGNPDSAGITLSVITHFSGKIPILGVCLGHQAIGQAFCAKVVRAPRVQHGKVSQIFHSEDGIYKGLPNPFDATRYHSLVVDRKSLPECLEVCAETKDGIVMGLRHREFDVEGLQFHPESFATRGGKTLLQNFMERTSK